MTSNSQMNVNEIEIIINNRGCVEFGIIKFLNLIEIYRFKLKLLKDNERVQAQEKREKIRKIIKNKNKNKRDLNEFYE